MLLPKIKNWGEVGQSKTLRHVESIELEVKNQKKDIKDMKKLVEDCMVMLKTINHARCDAEICYRSEEVRDALKGEKAEIEEKKLEIKHNSFNGGISKFSFRSWFAKDKGILRK